MTRALDPKATFSYVLEDDRDLFEMHPERPVFELRSLTIDEEERVSNSLFGGTMGSTELNVKSGSYQRTILNLGLTGWSNLNQITDDTNEDPRHWVCVPIEFAREKGNPRPIKSDLLDRLSSDARTELANAITGRGKVDADSGNV